MPKRTITIYEGKVSIEPSHWSEDPSECVFVDGECLITRYPLNSFLAPYEGQHVRISIEVLPAPKDEE